ncbi:MAG: hypothetical protein LBN95_10510 [Prevotellaceae bacterium]|jgi:hypothetical protein|nr:hypothetical protein [Prevotellaceae bacterium]
MQNKLIKVGILVSYDYELIKKSLPLIYQYADKIVLAVDKDGKTWAGNNIDIPTIFFEWIKDYDTDSKIEIYRDSFYQEGFTAPELDTRERNMLGKYMGEGGWFIQLDADEYFIDFKHFVDFLHHIDKENPKIVTVEMAWITLYKQVSTGFFIVKGNSPEQPIATKNPNYDYIRYPVNYSMYNSILYNHRIVHESFARSEEDLWKKISNWGHKDDFNTKSYFKMWQAIDENNYKIFHNIHPLFPHTWGHLEFVKANDVQSFLDEIKRTNLHVISEKPSTTVKHIVKLFIPPIMGKIKKYAKKFYKKYNYKIMKKQ